MYVIRLKLLGGVLISSNTNQCHNNYSVNSENEELLKIDFLADWGFFCFNDVKLFFVLYSAVVDISGRMGVSAVHAEAGILVNSSVYTVTQIKGNATYSQGELLKFEVGVPEEPVQFFNFS